MSLAEEIKNARTNMKVDISREMSVKELADKLSVSTQYLYQLEAGQHKSASLSFLKNYATETGVPIEIFIDAIEI